MEKQENYPERKTDEDLLEKILEEENRRALYRDNPQTGDKETGNYPNAVFWRNVAERDRGSFTYHAGKCTRVGIQAKKDLKKYLKRRVKMTYRELLKLYKQGKLEDSAKKQVEAEIEKQDAISEFLYEEGTIPDFSDLESGQERSMIRMTKIS